MPVQDYGLAEKILFGSNFPLFQPVQHAHDLLALALPEDSGRIFSHDFLRGILTNRPASLFPLRSA
jgi:predicted TIM-barrel fold metal-dependent hydrolase